MSGSATLTTVPSRKAIPEPSTATPAPSGPRGSRSSPRRRRTSARSTSSLQWILNGYLLTLASLILLGGSLGDRHGRRRVFALGVGMFTVASAVCAAAPNATLLVVARLLRESEERC